MGQQRSSLVGVDSCESHSLLGSCNNRLKILISETQNLTSLSRAANPTQSRDRGAYRVQVSVGGERRPHCCVAVAPVPVTLHITLSPASQRLRLPE